MIMNKIGGATQAAGDTDGIDAGSMMSALGIDSGGLLGGIADTFRLRLNGEGAKNV